ncbi:hypothetical protein GCM10009795_038810 [Nocardioides hankookensis]|uniref:AbiTii domain-containing protein n=1 Tax=Nocardioides hankookensis TaxID=443157 RepID=A0ABW1LPI8_9ACTN
MPTAPLALVELGNGRSLLPPSAMEDPRAGLLLEHHWVREGADELPVWVLSHGPQTPRDSIRRVRAHAMRLHCELEGFAAVLRACRLGVLDPAGPESLRTYLLEVAKRLLRQEYDGMPQASLLQYVAQKTKIDNEGRMSSLEEAFSDVSPSLRRMVRDVAALTESLGPEKVQINFVSDGGSLTMGDNNIVGSGNSVGSNNVKVGDNNTVSGVVGSNNDLRNNTFGDASSGATAIDLADQLVDQLRSLGAQLTGGELDLAETVAEQLRTENPPVDRIKRFLKSILDGIRTIGVSAAPAVATIASIHELLG